MNYFDLHCDTPFECYTKNQEFYVNSLSVSGESAMAFEDWTQVFAIWINDNEQNPWQLYKNILTDFKAKILQKPQNLTPVFSVENGVLLENDADRIYILKKDGIKLLTLTWNGENNIAGGVNSEKGLTDFGKSVIQKMNSLKMGCDLSHLNEKSFYSAIEIADYPLASHSNCFDVCNHLRNLKLEQIKLVAQKGGVVGLCFYPLFLGGDVFEKIYENIFFLCDKGFENNIAIGSDFDGAEMSAKLSYPKQIPELLRFLEEKGIKKDLIYKIFYKNAYNFIAKL